MVDGKGILDVLLGAAAAGGKQEQGTAGGSLEDILGQITGGSGGQQQAGSGGFLGNILGQVLGGGASPAQTGGQPGSGGLGDLLGQVFGGGSQHPQTGSQTAGSQPDGGGLGDLLGQVLGGAPGSAGGLFDAVKDAVARNPGLTQAALAGMAGLVLTSSKARSLATGAAKLGGIALIGGLAYQALRNYQNKTSASASTTALPQPEDYTPVAVSNDGALKLVRAMIGAAMADGEIDAEEQKKILGQMSPNALSDDQKAWLQAELSRPATAQQVVEGVSGKQEAIETYTAVRVVIDPDSAPNKAFLDTLANGLGLPAPLVAEIDKAVDGVKVDAAA